MDNIYLGCKARILKITKHTAREKSFFLEFKPDAGPGQYIMVSLPEIGEVPVTIAGFNEQGIEITVSNVGSVTSHLFSLKRNDYLFVRGPQGNTFPFEQFKDKHLLLIGAGSGVAAIKPLIEYYLKDNKHPVGRLDILTGFRTPKHILYKKELKEWGKKANIVVSVDSDEGEEEIWLGSIGFVVDFVKDVEDIGEETQVIIVGPPAMMNNAIRQLKANNAREENVWLSFERHMKCGVGKCGHCRIRDKYVCIDGPIFNYTEARRLVD